MFSRCFKSTEKQFFKISGLHRNKYGFQFKIIVLLLMIVVFEAVFYCLIEVSTKKNYIKENKNEKEVRYDDTSLFHSNKELDDSNVDTSNYTNDYYSLQIKIEKRLNHNRSIESNNKKIGHNERSKSSLNKKVYLIYQYTKDFSKTEVKYNNLNQLYLKECPYKNCKFTHDSSLVYMSDVILVKKDDFNFEVEIFLDKLNKYQRGNQIWMLWNDNHTNLPNELNKYKFNWTMSFRLDSEVFDCYNGCFYSKNKTNLNVFMDNIRSEFHARRNQALWIFNKCYQSTYIYYVLGIQINFPLRILGKCNNEIELVKKNKYSTRLHLDYMYIFLKSFFNFINGLFLGKREIENLCNMKCEFKEFKMNKFYILADDKTKKNTISDDFWRILKTSMIPIVFEPSKDIYELLAPVDSYIHASDYSNYYEIASYLETVSSEFDIYLKHHMWRLDHDVVYSTVKTQSRRMCQLCTKLNLESSVIYYENIVEWFWSD